MNNWSLIWATDLWYEQLIPDMSNWSLIWTTDPWYEQLISDMSNWSLIWTTDSWYEQLIPDMNNWSLSLIQSLMVMHSAMNIWYIKAHSNALYGSSVTNQSNCSSIIDGIIFNLFVFGKTTKNLDSGRARGKRLMTIRCEPASSIISELAHGSYYRNQSLLCILFALPINSKY